MAVRCTNCGHERSSADRFCIRCGAGIAPTGRGGAPAASPPAVFGGHDSMAPASAPGYAAAAGPAAYVPSQSPASPLGYAAAAGPAAPGVATLSAPAAASPQGAPEVPLTPGEQQLYEVNFAPKVLAPHLLTYLTVTDKRIIVRHPNTLFGFFPLGYLVSSAPHSSVEQVDSGMHVSSRKIAVGTVSLLATLWFAKDISQYGYFRWEYLVATLVALITAIACFITAKRVGIVIHNGGAHLFALARGHQQGDVQAAAHVVNRLLLESEASRGRSA